MNIFPTLAELAGLPAPTGPQPIDGVSLAPVLRDPAKSIRDHATSQPDVVGKLRAILARHPEAAAILGGKKN